MTTTASLTNPLLNEGSLDSTGEKVKVNEIQTHEIVSDRSETPSTGDTHVEKEDEGEEIPPQTELQSEDSQIFVKGLETSFELDHEEEDIEKEKEEIKLIQDEKLNSSYIPLSDDIEISVSSLPTTTVPTAPTSSSTNLFKLIRDITYIENSGNRKHRLDLYIPKTRKDDQLLDVVVHIHGGGWKRGDRSIEFYGAPSMCRFYAAGGFLAVAPSYRLGRHPHHMEDIVKALEWVHKNIKTYGGNPSRIYLSGHSAGGNMAALLAVHSSTLLPDLPTNFIRGAVCVSGVYSLHQPLGTCACTKNFIFTSRYVRPTFGTENNILITNSPTCLLQLRLGLSLPKALLPKKETKWSSLFHSSSTTTTTTTTTTVTTSMSTSSSSSTTTSTSISSTISSSATSSTSQHRPLPPFLLLSACWDMGLENDATNFYQLLQQAGSNVKHITIPNTNHATICWAPKTEELSLNFIREHLID